MAVVFNYASFEDEDYTEWVCMSNFRLLKGKAALLLKLWDEWISSYHEEFTHTTYTVFLSCSLLTSCYGYKAEKPWNNFTAVR